MKLAALAPLLLALAACAADDPTPLDVIVDPSLEAPPAPRFTCYGPLPQGDSVCDRGEDGGVYANAIVGDPLRIYAGASPGFYGWTIELSIGESEGSVCLRQYTDVDDGHEPPDPCAYYGHITISAREPPLTVFFQAAFNDDAQLSGRFVVEP